MLLIAFGVFDCGLFILEKRLSIFYIFVGKV